MRLAIDAVRDGEAAGVVSAGNTGALMAMAKFVLKTLPGIDRPAIASFFPTLRGESVMLDLGANVECDADNLVQFAVMGEVFARTVLGLTQPTIGLLNVGSEEHEGPRGGARAAARSCATTNLPMQFHGFVEGDDIAAGTVDVVVTDGFTGNVALKTAEGTAELYSEFLRGAFKSSLLAQLGYLLARPALDRVRERIDPRRYNGAILLGLNGIVVKSHGGTDALRLRQCHRRRHGHGGQRLQRPDPRRPRAPLAALRAGRSRSRLRQPTRERRCVPRSSAAAAICRPTVVTNDELARSASTPPTTGSPSAPASASATSRADGETDLRSRHQGGRARALDAAGIAAQRRRPDRAGHHHAGRDLSRHRDARAGAASASPRRSPSTSRRSAPASSMRSAIADNFLKAGQARTALVIGAETFSRILDWNDRGTCVLFGDGAGAVVLRAGDGDGTAADRGILSTHLHSDGRFHDSLYVDGGPSVDRHGRPRAHGRQGGVPPRRRRSSPRWSRRRWPPTASSRRRYRLAGAAPGQPAHHRRHGAQARAAAEARGGHGRSPRQHLGRLDPAGAGRSRRRRPHPAGPAGPAGGAWAAVLPGGRRHPLVGRKC